MLSYRQKGGKSVKTLNVVEHKDQKKNRLDEIVITIHLFFISIELHYKF